MSAPKVWSRFSATRKSDDTIVFKFRIQEATANEKEEILDFIQKYCMNSESFYKAAGVSKSDEAIKEMLSVYDMIYNDIHTTVCYEDKDKTARTIIGINMVGLEKAEDGDKLTAIRSQLKTPEIKKLFDILSLTKELCDGIKTLGLQTYFSGRGVCVRPDFTGFGIAREFMKIRRELCKEFGVQATGAYMTAIGSQKAAERDGWTTAFEIPFDELGRLCGCEFIDAPPLCKMMISYCEI